MRSACKGIVCLTTALICFLLPGSAVAIAHLGERSSFESGWQSPPKLSPEDEARLADLETRLKLAESHGDAAAQSDLLNSIGVLRYKADQFDEAIEAFTRALVVSRDQSNERGEATTLAELGATYIKSGAVREGLEAYQKSLPLWKKLDTAQAAAILGRVAEVFRQLGDRTSALRFNEQALQAFRDAGDQAGEAAVLNNIGLSYFVTGNKKKGIEFFNRAWMAYHAAGSEPGEGAALNNLAVGYSLSGDQLSALAMFEKAMTLQGKRGNHIEVAALLQDIGVVYSKMGQMEKARFYCDAALSMYGAMGNHEAENRTLAILTSLDKKRRGRLKMRDQLQMELAQSPPTQ